jgi:biotin carboxyl carrier protein
MTTITTQTTTHDDLGEQLAMPERVVIAPAVGIFRPLPPESVTAEGELVTEGQAIGTIEVVGESRVVHSPFTGFLMGMLASAGERVRKGQPVAWLRVTGAPA